jgi:hypothetical protein
MVLPMTPRTLIDKIESLPPDKRAEVEDFVDFLAARARTSEPSPKRFPDELLRRIDERRERLFREHGLFDTLPFIREFRETGGR